MAARDERILESPRSAGAAGRSLVGGLHVVDFEIGREVHLRRFEHREVAVARDGDDQRSGFVGLDAVLAHFRADLEVAYAAPERSRRSRRKLLHLDVEGGSTDAFADGLVLVEKVIEDRERAAAGRADAQLADHLGRIDGQRAGLLGNQHPLPDQRTVVNAPVNIFPVEFEVVDRDGLLAPEAVESRELDIFETHDFGAGVKLERGGDGLAFDHIRLVERQPKENVFVGDGTRDGRIVLLRPVGLGLLTALRAVAAATVAG